MSVAPDVTDEIIQKLVDYTKLSSDDMKKAVRIYTNDKQHSDYDSDSDSEYDSDSDSEYFVLREDLLKNNNNDIQVQKGYEFFKCDSCESWFGYKEQIDYLTIDFSPTISREKGQYAVCPPCTKLLLARISEETVNEVLSDIHRARSLHTNMNSKSITSKNL